MKILSLRKEAAMSQFYTAYVGSYTDINTCKGLTIFDVDVERGDLKKRGEVEVSNATYLITSPDRRYLYAATDKGVASFRILPDGNLRRLNTAICRPQPTTVFFLSPAILMERSQFCISTRTAPWARLQTESSTKGLEAWLRGISVPMCAAQS